MSIIKEVFMKKDNYKVIQNDKEPVINTPYKINKLKRKYNRAKSKREWKNDIKKGNY